MRKKYIALLFAAAALMLSACATAPTPRSPMVVDKDYVGSVEAEAKRVGVDVFWVNPPRRDRKTEDSS